MLTLWDLIEPIRRVLAGPKPAMKRRSRVRAVPASGRLRAASSGLTAQDRYDAIVKELLGTHGIRVRKWRTSMSGVAWITTYRDGSAVRCIESPRPKSPMSLAIFLHEVGHHVIGLGAYRPRCLEEYHAWVYAVTEMEKRGVPVTDRVKRRMDRSLRYAVSKASRRGLKSLPPELHRYATP
ncbi:MAG: hypothetical protein DYG92_08750 [Leptolyngbya sp. PLA1]|nr:hypothetical protein [Leptolyngbya sp. PLA1]